MIVMLFFLARRKEQHVCQMHKRRSNTVKKEMVIIRRGCGGMVDAADLKSDHTYTNYKKHNKINRLNSLTILFYTYTCLTHFSLCKAKQIFGLMEINMCKFLKVKQGGSHA